MNQPRRPVTQKAAVMLHRGGAGEVLPMESRGAAAVSKMLANEARKTLRAAVSDHRSWDIDHARACGSPSRAEIAILGCNAEAGVESADRAESIGGERHVVGGEEAGVLGIGVVELVRDVLDDL